MDAASLNKMLESAVMDMGSRKSALSRDEHRARAFSDRVCLEKSLGLYPQPSRTPLNARITGTLERDGYRIEKLAYESRPGVTVTAHLYLPAGEGPFPLVVSTVEDGEQKKVSPWVQSRGVGLALYGFAALMVDSPGGIGERAAMGDPRDPWLALGAPAAGHYVWDMLRALDYCESRPDLDVKRAGITGGEAAAFAFAIDERFKAAVAVGWGSSLEVLPTCDRAPGVALIGDRADVLAIRAPAPVMLIGAAADPLSPPDGQARSLEKLRAIYQMFDLPDRVRLQVIETARDYNRRMREGMYSFFLQHLMDHPALPYAPELRPMTDGARNPYERGTEPADSPELVVLEQPAQGLTFRQELDRALSEPNPEPNKAEQKLIPWGKHGRIENLEPGDVLLIHDEDHRPEPAGSKRLPISGISHEMCFCLGISVAEFLAQVLHYRLPGRPEGWESQSLAGDALTSMIASVKTIVEGVNPPAQLRRLEAVGPVASEVARHLRMLRPGLEIRVSHPWQSWQEQMGSGLLPLAMPLARYRSFS